MALGDDVRGGEEVAPATWPEGVVHLHRAGRSTRGIEVERVGAAVSIRMLACANRSDWDLAFQLFERIGATPIKGEDDTTVTLTDARHGFEQVIAGELSASISTLLAIVNQGKELQLKGPTRDVYFGPRALREIGNDPEAVLERIRRIQYIEDEGFEFIEYSNLSAMMGLNVELGFSLWDPRRAQAFGPTTHLGLSAGESLHVPLAALPEIVGSRFSWLDEKQFTIAATPEAEIQQLVERAERVAFNPYAKMNKRWWQFWK